MSKPPSNNDKSVLVYGLERDWYRTGKIPDRTRIALNNRHWTIVGYIHDLVDSGFLTFCFYQITHFEVQVCQIIQNKIICSKKDIKMLQILPYEGFPKSDAPKYKYYYPFEARHVFQSLSEYEEFGNDYQFLELLLGNCSVLLTDKSIETDADIPLLCYARDKCIKTLTAL